MEGELDTERSGNTPLVQSQAATAGEGHSLRAPEMMELELVPKGDGEKLGERKREGKREMEVS